MNKINLKINLRQNISWLDGGVGWREDDRSPSDWTVHLSLLLLHFLEQLDRRRVLGFNF